MNELLPSTLARVLTLFVAVASYIRFNSSTLLDFSFLNAAMATRKWPLLLTWRSKASTSTPDSEAGLDRPANSHTTAYKFQLYRLLYTFIWVAFYWLLWKVEESRSLLYGLLDSLTLVKFKFLPHIASPLILSFCCAYVLPLVFRPLDRALRGRLYQAALIPAARKKLQATLKKATFTPDRGILRELVTRLGEEGFVPGLLVYEQVNSVRSMWAKILLLVKKLEAA